MECLIPMWSGRPLGKKWMEQVNVRAATFTHNILNGANTSEIQVENPIAFDLVVNPDAAEAIGMTFPESFLLRATEVVRD